MALGAAFKFPGDGVTNPPYAKLPNSGYEGTFDSTVYLWDAEYQPLESIPGNGTTLNNLMRARAAEVSGLLPSQCDIDVTNSLNNASAILASGEITPKGGIHVASPQAGGQVAASSLGMSLSSSFANWLLGQTDAGADYAVLATLFLRCTRARAGASSAPQSLAHIVSATAPTTNRLFHMSHTTPSSGAALAANVAPPTVGNAGLGCVSSQGWGGTKPATLDGGTLRRLAVLGCADGWASSNYNLAPSFILYRAQLDLVDLSEVAGADRTAKCNAMIAQLQAMAARDFAAGRRFGDDTFTPAIELKP